MLNQTYFNAYSNTNFKDFNNSKLLKINLFFNLKENLLQYIK